MVRPASATTAPALPEGAVPAPPPSVCLHHSDNRSDLTETLSRLTELPLEERAEQLVAIHDALAAELRGTES